MTAWYLVLTVGQVYDPFLLSAFQEGDDADSDRLWNGEIFDRSDRVAWEASAQRSAAWIELFTADEWRLNREGNVLRYDGPHDEPW